MTHWNDGDEWLQCEDDFLSENRHTMTMERLSQRLGRSPDAIRVRQFRLDRTKELFDRIPSTTEEETIGEWIARTQKPLIERCVAYSRSR